MNMVDLAIKWAIAAAAAEIVTRRVTPANAAAAHRIWLLVLLAPVWWAAGEWLVEPVVFAQLRRGVIPAGLAPHGVDTLTLMFAGYAAVAALLLLRIGAGLWSVRRLTRDATPVTGADLDILRQVIGEEDAKRIREGRLEVPVTAGVLSPTILLPAGWQAMPRESLAAILHHEAAHARRRDCAVAIAAAVVEAIFWFHPAAWRAASRVRWFAEMACDAEAARAMTDGQYASALLSLAAGWSDARRPRYTLTAGAETNVARRIHLLLDELEHGGRRSLRLAVGALLLLAAVPVSPLIEAGRVSDGWTLNSHSVNHAAHMHKGHN